MSLGIWARAGIKPLLTYKIRSLNYTILPLTERLKGFAGDSDNKESVCNADMWEDPLEEEMATHFSILA